MPVVECRTVIVHLHIALRTYNDGGGGWVRCLSGGGGSVYNQHSDCLPIQ